MSCEIVDPRTLLPLDEETIIDSVKKTSRLVTVQESAKAYGYGAEIIALVAENALEFLDAPVPGVGHVNVPIGINVNAHRLLELAALKAKATPLAQ